MATANGDRPYCGVSPVCELRHDTSGDTHLSSSIIEAVSTAKKVDPTDCDLELYDAVDLEALDTLFERRAPDGHWKFEFGVGDHVVVVNGCGRIAVYDSS
ncbi:hypothetical protein NGM10_09625 [Halorussus salilacus]|uniref:HalOD1 output domain-containing protein n=1 Tax=Halorussus salilacus TaxID=2953750 RepID=UPI0020A09425|nr:HalOD1 output domain-containing protein [Halorussus salilacus]USZ66989.1 hypothetical protein NGM10_09625 [Halorussus salilacus]